MNQEKFIKEHPGLKGKIIDFEHTQTDDGHLVYTHDVHETQIDKEKVKEVLHSKNQDTIYNDLKECLPIKDFDSFERGYRVILRRIEDDLKL